MCLHLLFDQRSSFVLFIIFHDEKIDLIGYLKVHQITDLAILGYFKRHRSHAPQIH